MFLCLDDLVAPPIMQGSRGVSVLCVCLFFLLLFAVVFLNMRFSYNRDMLMNIRGTMPVSLIPEFLTFEEDIIKRQELSDAAEREGGELGLSTGGGSGDTGFLSLLSACLTCALSVTKSKSLIYC